VPSKGSLQLTDRVAIYRTCLEHGYEYANSNYCAHLIGEFAHVANFSDDAVNYACPDNHVPMSAPDVSGAVRHWVLEIHLLQDPAVGK
jgi:hypothetical protein